MHRYEHHHPSDLRDQVPLQVISLLSGVPDLLSLSDPARSTRLSLPLVMTPFCLLSLITVMVSIMWDRDECSFMLVIAAEKGGMGGGRVREIVGGEREKEGGRGGGMGWGNIRTRMRMSWGRGGGMI